MGLYTGFIEGVATYTKSGDVKLLPFEDKIAEAELMINGDLLFAETIGFDGIYGKSAACFHKREVSFKFMSQDISWSFLQLAMSQASTARTAPVPVGKTLQVGASGAVTLPSAPVSGQPIAVADIEGVDMVFTVTGSTVTITGPTVPAQGSRVTVSYFEAAPTNAKEIAVGTGEIIKEVSLYGRFYGCPDSLLVIANRVVVKPTVTLGVKSGSAASAGLEAMALRDTLGNFAYIVKS